MLTVRSKALLLLLGPPCWRMTQFVAGKAHLAKKKNESYLINPSLCLSLSLWSWVTAGPAGRHPHLFRICQLSVLPAFVCSSLYCFFFANNGHRNSDRHRGCLVLYWAQVLFHWLCTVWHDAHHLSLECFSISLLSVFFAKMSFV